MNSTYLAKPYHDINSPFGIDENGAFAEYIINDPDHLPQLALGATIIIRDERELDSEKERFWYSGNVVGLRSISPFHPERTTMLYQKDEIDDPSNILETTNGPHNHQPMIIRVSLSMEWSSTDRQFSSSAIQKPPSGYSRLSFPTINSEDENYGPNLRTILGIKREGIDLGLVGFGNKPYNWNKPNEQINYRWDINTLDNKHMFIVGESGSGKTVFLKNLAYQIRKFGNKVILTDVQGDISQLLFWNEENILKSKQGWQSLVKRESPIQLKSYFGKIRLIIPETNDEYAKADISALEKKAMNVGVDARRISLRFQDLDSPGDVEYLFRTSSTQVTPLLEEIVEDLKNREDPHSLARLQTALVRLLTRNSGSQITVSTSGVSYYRSTFEAARRVLRGLENYFDIDKEALNQNGDPLDAFNYDGTTILYLDHLNQEERFMWEMQLVKWLYRNKKKIENTYVFIDEAHQIIPGGNSSSSGINSEVFTRLRSNFEKLAREGRKFRVNLVLSTQSPRDIHPIVQDQCPTRIVMKINKKNATVSGLDPGLAHIASNFSQGQFWIQSPFNGSPDWVRVHSTAPAVPHTSMENFRKFLKAE